MLNAIDRAYGRIREEDITKVIRVVSDPICSALLATRGRVVQGNQMAAVQEWLINHHEYLNGSQTPDKLYKHQIESAYPILREAFPVGPASSFTLYVVQAFLNLFEGSLMDMSDYNTLLSRWQEDAAWLTTKEDRLVVRRALTECWKSFSQTQSWQAHQARSDEFSTISLSLPSELNPWQYLASVSSMRAVKAVQWRAREGEDINAERLSRAIHNLGKEDALEALNRLSEAGVMKESGGGYISANQHLPVLAHVCRGLFELNDEEIRRLLVEAVAFRKPSESSEELA